MNIRDTYKELKRKAYKAGGNINNNIRDTYKELKLDEMQMSFEDRMILEIPIRNWNELEDESKNPLLAVY